MEIELGLSMEKYQESDRHFDKEAYNALSGSMLEKLLAYGGFVIISEKINMKDNFEYTLDLGKFWHAATETVIRHLVSVGMSIHAGFSDHTGSFSWFFSSDLGSRQIRVDEYSL